MNFLNIFKKKEEKNFSKENVFNCIFNKDSKNRINKIIKKLNKTRIKPGVFSYYERYSTLITINYDWNILRINIPQKNSFDFYNKKNKEIFPEPGNFGEIEAKLFFEINKWNLLVNINSKKNYDHLPHSKYDFEEKKFSDVFDVNSIISFLINKIIKFDNEDKSRPFTRL